MVESAAPFDPFAATDMFKDSVAFDRAWTHGGDVVRAILGRVAPVICAGGMRTAWTLGEPPWAIPGFQVRGIDIAVTVPRTDATLAAFAEPEDWFTAGEALAEYDPDSSPLLVPSRLSNRVKVPDGRAFAVIAGPGQCVDERLAGAAEVLEYLNGDRSSAVVSAKERSELLNGALDEYIDAVQIVERSLPRPFTGTLCGSVFAHRAVHRAYFGLTEVLVALGDLDAARHVSTTQMWLWPQEYLATHWVAQHARTLGGSTGPSRRHLVVVRDLGRLEDGSYRSPEQIEDDRLNETCVTGDVSDDADDVR